MNQLELERATRELNEWFSAEWQKLTAEKQRRAREIERAFWEIRDAA